MAKLKIAHDGHPYLTHGYEDYDESRAETRYCTYQLHPRAEDLFREAGIEEGSSIIKPTFYALLLDGDLHNEARPSGIHISAVPRSINRTAVDIFSSGILEVKIVGQRKYTLDYYSYFTNKFDKQIAIALASNYTIYVHAKA